jgi:2-keto-3-deoxy-L-rhamnonate aldolase RhmA
MNVETMTQVSKCLSDIVQTLIKLGKIFHDVQYIREGRTIAMVRWAAHSLADAASLTSRSVPGIDHPAIGYALDAGASIVIPLVETVEQAREIVAATKFGARIGGARSAPPAGFCPASRTLQCSRRYRYIRALIDKWQLSYKSNPC